MNSTSPIKFINARDLPHALMITGNCPCGEHAHSTFRRRSNNGKGRPYHTVVECASCGRLLSTWNTGKSGWYAAVYDYSPAANREIKTVSAIYLATINI
jgi:hypothetical protein